MKSFSISAVCAITLLSLSSVAHADDNTPHVGFWARVKAAFSSKKNEKTAPAPIAAPAPGPAPTQYTKLLRYSVSLGAKDDCSTIAQNMASALLANPTAQMEYVAGPTAKCSENTATFEGNSYRQGDIEISFTYVMHGWAAYSPALNIDYLAGHPTFDGLADGAFGVFPTYQSCLDAAATIVSGFEGQTGATPLAFFCKESKFGLSYSNLADETAQVQQNPSLKFGPDRNFALAIYSAGKEAKRLLVYENQGGNLGDPTDKIPEVAVTIDLLSNSGRPVVYPADASKIGSDPLNTEATYIAYYSPYMAQIENWIAGRAANASECKDQLQKAVKIWSTLGAKGAQAFCESSGPTAQSLVVISVDGPFIMDDAGDNDLTYASYDECMKDSEQAAVIQARGNSRKQGVLCFPDQDQMLGQGQQNIRYRAQFYFKS